MFDLHSYLWPGATKRGLSGWRFDPIGAPFRGESGALRDRMTVYYNQFARRAQGGLESKEGKDSLFPLFGTPRQITA
jgi:hypothetical protein